MHTPSDLIVTITLWMDDFAVNHCFGIWFGCDDALLLPWNYCSSRTNNNTPPSSAEPTVTGSQPPPRTNRSSGERGRGLV